MVMIMFKWYRIVVDIKHIHLDNVKVLSKTQLMVQKILH